MSPPPSNNQLPIPGSTSTSASAVPEAGVVTSRTSVSSSSNSREVSDWRACDNRRGRPLPYFFTGTRDDLGNLKLIETGKKRSSNCKTEKKQLKTSVGKNSKRMQNFPSKVVWKHWIPCHLIVPRLFNNLVLVDPMVDFLNQLAPWKHWKIQSQLGKFAHPWNGLVNPRGKGGTFIRRSTRKVAQCFCTNRWNLLIGEDFQWNRSIFRWRPDNFPVNVLLLLSKVPHHNSW